MIVNLDGFAAGNEPNGLGYDEAASPRCYAKGIDATVGLPGSLRRSRVGQPVTVNLQLLAPDAGALEARVPLQRRRRDDPAPGDSSDYWFRRLGCHD